MTGYPAAAIVLGVFAAFVAAPFLGALIARSGFPLPPEHGRIGCVDGLRGLLALAVLAHHFIIWMQVNRLGGGWAAPGLNLFNQLGAGGVGLFFMTSGLVFYPRVRAGFRATSWLALLIGRLFRVVPLLVLSVAAVTFVIVLRTGRGWDGNFPGAALQWITTWGEPPLLGYPDSGRLNAYVLWSLWYEWVFYLFVLPACALLSDLVRGRMPGWLVPAALLLGAVGLQALRHRPPPLLLVLPLFAVGMLAFECAGREWIARRLRTPAATAASLAALVLAMTAFPTPYGLALPLYGFFFACVACGNPMGGLLSTRGALVLGECAYGIYLLHGLVLSVLFTEGTPWIEALATEQLPLLLPPTALAVTLLACLGYRLVERPGIRLGRRLSSRLVGRRPSAGASGFATPN